MHRHPGRIRRMFAAAVLGSTFAAIAPQGCAGYLQQNAEVLFRFDAVAGGPEMFQSWIYQFITFFR